MSKKPLHIGIIAPGSALVDNEAMQRAADGLTYLHELGYATTLASNIKLEKVDGVELIKTSIDEGGLNTAGSVKERVEAIHEIYSNPEIDIVLALRGGYGCIQLLDHLKYGLIRRGAKPLLGYSDITALFMAFAAKAKRRSYHAPMLSELSTMSALTAGSFKDILNILSEKKFPKIKDLEQNPVSMKLPRNARILGGNLSLLTSLTGTKYLPSFKGSYLLLEDCNEPAYKIDRMLENLRLAGVFKGIKGVLVGEPQEADFSYRVFEQLKVPVYKRLLFGHGAVNVVAPIN